MWVIERVAVRTVCKLWCTATVACLSAVWADPAAAQVPGIEVTQRWASRGGPRNPFDEIRGMVEDGAGRIWVSDGRAGVLHELTATGRHVRVVGHRGEGRGEFREPGRLAALGEGRIAVHDEARSSIEVLENGRSIRRVQLDTPVVSPKGFAALPDGGWVVSGVVVGSPYAIHAFDAEGALRASWFEVPRSEDPEVGVLAAGGPVAVGEGGVLYIVGAVPHGLFRFAAVGAEGVELAAVAGLVPAVAVEAIEGREGEQGRARCAVTFRRRGRCFLSGTAGC